MFEKRLVCLCAHQTLCLVFSIRRYLKLLIILLSYPGSDRCRVKYPGNNIPSIVCIGFAFVEFEDPRDADDAVKALDDTKMNGKRVTVEIATGKKKGSGSSYLGTRDSRDYRRRSRSRSRSPRRRDRSDSRDRRDRSRDRRTRSRS